MPITISAIATDMEGRQVNLGAKTITVDNANAVKPFGTLDVPEQGGTVSGDNFVNWGWVLTPMPNRIPEDGSSIYVYVNGIKLGHPVYNRYRADIADLFPGYANSSGAVGYFRLDTTAFDNGVYTIYWVASDNAGNTDGIGSRYMTIQNQDASRTHSKTATGFKVAGHNIGFDISQIASLPVDRSGPCKVIRGYNENVEPFMTVPGQSGVNRVVIKELERLEIQLSPGSKSITGYMVSGRRLYPLPIGSTLRDGIFYWSPGPGFLGEYRLVFVIKNQSWEWRKKEIQVEIEPLGAN